MTRCKNMRQMFAVSLIKVLITFHQFHELVSVRVVINLFVEVMFFITEIKIHYYFFYQIVYYSQTERYMEGYATEKDGITPEIHEEEVHVLNQILMFCIKILIIKVIWISRIDGNKIVL